MDPEVKGGLHLQLQSTRTRDILYHQSSQAISHRPRRKGPARDRPYTGRTAYSHLLAHYRQRTTGTLKISGSLAASHSSSSTIYLYV